LTQSTTGAGALAGVVPRRAARGVEAGGGWEPWNKGAEGIKQK